VTSFELANAPSTFQKFINWILREHLDDFLTAYVNDILIFSESTLENHENKIATILEKLRVTNLRLDINKCEFSVKIIKYLEFIIKTEKRLRMNSEKMKVITE